MAEQRRPHVFVDGRMAFHSGIGRYVRNHLALLRDHPFYFSVGVEKRQHKQWLARYIEGSTEHLSFILHPFASRGLSQFLRPRSLFQLMRADIHWFPHLLLAPFRLPPNSIVTIHDLIPLHGKIKVEGKVRGTLFRQMLRRVAKQAACIVCGSRTVAEEVIALEPLCQERVRLVRNGVLANYWIALSAEQRAQVRRSMGVQRYVLMVGIAESRKNQRLCFEVLERLREEFSDLSVIVVGESAKRRRKPSELEWNLAVRTWKAEHPRLARRLVCLGEVNEFHLWKLYSAAEALLFPSLDEGFGLPVLEAMASGTCVIASNRMPIAEVAGGHSLLANPEDPDCWVEKLTWLLSHPKEISQRRELGLHYVHEQWSWEHSTQALADAFEFVLGHQAAANVAIASQRKVPTAEPSGSIPSAPGEEGA